MQPTTVMPVMTISLKTVSPMRNPSTGAGSTMRHYR